MKGFIIESHIKDNLARIAVKIKGRPKVDEGSCLFRIKDMIRATITVQDYNTLEVCYDLLTEIESIKVMKVRSRLMRPYRDVKLNVMFDS